MITVLLADGHRMVRDGLRAYLDREADIEMVGEAETGIEAVERTAQLHPQVVIMDIGLPELNGIEATRQISRACPEVRVIGLSATVEERFVAEMMSAGAVGYLPKKSGAGELAEAVRTVARGRTYLSPEVAGGVIEQYVNRRHPARDSAFVHLSVREREVLQLLSEGLSIKEISSRLHVSCKTAYTHRQHVMDKLDMHSDAELTRYAIREGLTAL